MESISGLNSTTNTANKLRNIIEGNVKPNYQVAPTDVFTLIISFITCPFMVLFNVMVIMAVKRRQRLQTNSNILLDCLAATDALTGLITQPAFILWKTFGLTGGEDHIRALRLIYFAAIQALSACSCLHLMLVTGERLVAIKFIMHYPFIVTKKTIKVAVISCWIVSLTPVSFKFMEVLKIQSLAVPGFLLFVVSSCIIFVVSVYAVLYLETRRHQKLIKGQQMPQEEVQRFLKENKALQTTVYVVGAVAVCYLPLALQIANLLKKRTAIIAPELIRTVVLLNSLLNPLVYCWRQKEIRKFVFKTKTQAVNPHSE